MKKILIPIIVIVALVGAYAALALSADITPIESVINNPDEYEDSSVALMGEVSNLIAYQEVVLFELSEGDNTIPVHTTGKAPELGSEVVVEGVLEAMVEIGPYSFGIVVQASEVRAPYLWERWP